jgi:hypothetical protein
MLRLLMADLERIIASAALPEKYGLDTIGS